MHIKLLIAVFILLDSRILLAENILRIGMVGEPMSLNPLLRQSAQEGYVNFFYHRNFTHYNSKSESVPHLVQGSLKFVGSNIHGEIRPDAKWDDGNLSFVMIFRRDIR